ncbi:MBL fold metallo-hydrolase [Eubacteriales bacterium OttesenSCG-928-M02]|nr:MBL fold metallo-hydrolase [Eubacteriales bacterium OttesenSCG-928-M02]
MSESPFTSKEIFLHTYVIKGGWCDCYLLLGEEEGIMVDAGWPDGSLLEYARTLTDLPITKVINTHRHIDHTAGNGYFDTIYATEGTARGGKNTLGKDPKDFRLDYDFTIIEDGDVLEIKGRQLEIIQLDCHSPGNIAILDMRGQLLFVGDEVETGQVLLLPGYAEKPGEIHSRPAATLETYLRALFRMKSYWHRYAWLCPSHNGTPLKREYLDRYMALVQSIMARTVKPSKDCASDTYNDTMSHFPLKKSGYLRAELDGASLVYQEKLIWDGDYEISDKLPPATQAHIDAEKTVWMG